MTNRLLRNTRKRLAVKAKDKLEKLCAAFQQETGLTASEVMLRQQTVTNDQGGMVLELWFDKIRADMSSVHPDISFAFDLLMTYVEAYEQNKSNSVDLLIKESSDFVKFSDEFYLMCKDLCDKYKADPAANLTPVTLGKHDTVQVSP